MNVLSFDLGASSGRGILAKFDEKKIMLEEIHRFPHNFSVLNGHSYWNILSLMDEIQEGMFRCKEELSSVGFDTWGVDFGLLDREGNLISLPGSYRDSSLNEENRQSVLARIAGADQVSPEAVRAGEKMVFEQTGIASLAYNTLYKLCYMQQAMPSQLERAETMLLMPNLIEYFLSGVRHSEYSIASTTQIYNMKEKVWAYSLIKQLGLPEQIFASVDYSGHDLGPLRSDVAHRVGKRGLHIISVSGHDTACAVAAVPAREKEFTFLSSGTWSLLGISSQTMLEGKAIIDAKISNEGTSDGGYRPTVNINGLWMLQELKRNLEHQGENYSFAQLASLAKPERPLQSFIRPEDFMQPGDYPEQIREYCRKTGQPVPQNVGALVRCILESLAMKYKEVYNSMRPFITWEEKLYVVGGGVQNDLLNQFTANALGIPVVTGASEATAVGNVMEQLKSFGVYQSREEKCRILEASFQTKEILPQPDSGWEEAYQRFEALYRI